jgi:AcrR family transcriptional regulator
VNSASEEPAWKVRTVERSTQAAKLRAEKRVVRFLEAAQLIMADKGSTDFTVQEVVDRSSQSLRSFYLHFDGKHELLLALFEDALARATSQIRAAVTDIDDPLARLRTAIQLLFEFSCRSPATRRPLFTDFAPRLLITHPGEVRDAHAPLLKALTELLTEAREAGLLGAEVKPRRMAALIMQTVMFNAQSSGDIDDGTTHPLTADEVWSFCAYGCFTSRARH